MIIKLYLLREIVAPLTIALIVLCVLFMSYGAASFLADAVNGLLPTDMIVEVIGLRTLIALEMLIPISLYLSIVMALGRMYTDSEMTALFALGGLTPASLLAFVFTLSLGVAILVAGLSLVARPWAYARSHELARAAAASLHTDNMQAGIFYEGSKGDRTIYIERREGPATPGGGVFVQLRLHDGRTRIIYAKSVELVSTLSSGSQMRLSGAHVYEIGGNEGHDVVLNSNDLMLQLAAPSIDPPEYSAIAASTAHLRRSEAAVDMAELQWRESTSVTTLLLGLLAVPLSRARPRQPRNTKVGIAILIYAGYYLFYESARVWVQTGVIPAFPGLWIAPVSLALVVGFALFDPQLIADWKRRAAA